ncbi:MAG: UbiX family flavin prenyltransferase [Thermoplasmata archaeon]
MKILIGVSGASGAIYAYTLLKNIKEEKHLIVSEHAKELIEFELNLKIDKFRKLADHCYDDNDLSAPVSSGSFKIDTMVIVPASVSTISKIANGIADTLITRAAAVSLKERRKLIIVFREMPLSTIHLKNMYELSLAGAMIVPAAPAFYTKPKSIEDLTEQVSGRVMDMIGLESNIPRWTKSLSKNE